VRIADDADAGQGRSKLTTPRHRLVEALGADEPVAAAQVEEERVVERLQEPVEMGHTFLRAAMLSVADSQRRLPGPGPSPPPSADVKAIRRSRG
jgi:hypothetical protein